MGLGAHRRQDAARALSWAGLASLALHFALVAGVLFAALHRTAPPPAPSVPQRAVRVALVLEEHKGAGRPQAAAVPTPRPPPPHPPVVRRRGPWR
ncbi:MAG: hypothetical protein ACREFY_04330, partial [Acetobacteraceae bacterium]